MARRRLTDTQSPLTHDDDVTNFQRSPFATDFSDWSSKNKAIIPIILQEHPDADPSYDRVRDSGGAHVRGDHHEQGDEQPLLSLPV